jgi:hypothetical protein
MLHKQQVSLTAQVPTIFYTVRGGAVLYQQEKPSLPDTIALIKRELKALQDGSEGRIRLQYAVSEEEKYLYIVGHIADYDEASECLLYDFKYKTEDLLARWGWEVALSVVQKTDRFRSYVPLSDI